MEYLLYSLSAHWYLSLPVLAFSLWMVVDCLRSGRDWYWVWIIMAFQPFGGLVYYIVHHWDSSGANRSLLKRVSERQRIRELQAEIHHLDKAYHYTKLADIYRGQGRWAEAQKNYEAALAREPKSLEVKAHLAHVLLEQGETARAWPLFAEALTENEHYEYGELLWQGARCRVRMGDEEGARELYERLLSRQTYAEARLEYAELLERAGQKQTAADLLKRVVADGSHAPKIHVRKNRRAVRQARARLRKLGVAV